MRHEARLGNPDRCRRVLIVLIVAGIILTLRARP
jgi:hypothetical protein